MRHNQTIILSVRSKRTAMRHLIPILCLLWALPIIGACQPISAESDQELRGRITLWHSWTGQEAAELGAVLAQFQEIHPNVQIVELALPEDQILAEFRAAAENGLAPGVMIGQDQWIRELVDDGLIRPFPADDASLVLVNPRNRDLVEFKDQLFGVPLFLSPRAMYFNQNLVTAPARSLDQLLEEAAAGNRVEIVPRFEEAFWGIQAFGEGLFDADGRFTLADSGFEEWLEWLDNAQNAQGVILNVDEESLLDLFASGQIAYFVSGPDSLRVITDRIDPEDEFEIGIAPLPAGPSGASGPITEAETLLFYSHASPEQARIANALAAFLFNQRQGIRFMRELEKVPANPRIAVDRRVYPIASGFAQQARTSVTLPNEILLDQFVAAGNHAYTSVLSGAATPAEAVCQFGREVVAFQAYLPDQVDLPEACDVSDN